MTARPSRTSRLLFAAAALIALLAAPTISTAQIDAWALLRQPGHVAFMRHSDAPGFGWDFLVS